MGTPSRIEQFDYPERLFESFSTPYFDWQQLTERNGMGGDEFMEGKCAKGPQTQGLAQTCSFHSSTRTPPRTCHETNDVHYQQLGTNVAHGNLET